MTERHEEKTLVVDIIVVVLSAEHPNVPQTLIDEIYNEANVKNKRKVFVYLLFCWFDAQFNSNVWGGFSDKGLSLVEFVIVLCVLS